MFDWDNRQNGALIGSIGVVSALVQGGYVRRAIAKIGEGKMASRGIASCWLGLLCLSLVPQFVSSNPSLSHNFLRVAAVCMAFTSATVVNSLTSYASLQCDEGAIDEDTGKVTQEHPELAKGKALGKFRSSGQLGRAIGPVLGTSLLSIRALNPAVSVRTLLIHFFIIITCSLCLLLDIRTSKDICGQLCPYVRRIQARRILGRQGYHIIDQTIGQFVSVSNLVFL